MAEFPAPLAEPAPNTLTRPYRGLSVQHVDFPLTEARVRDWLLGREAYRHTEFVVLRRGDEAAVAAVRKATLEPLMAPIVEVRVLAGPQDTALVHAPEADVGNASTLAEAATRLGPPGALAYVVTGRYEHVNFIWRPSPVRIRVMEVVPPRPAKLLEMARQAVAFDEDLPPVRLELDAVDLQRLAAAHPADRYLVPCRGSGVDVGGAVDYLDARPPERRDWLLLGCERSLQFHRHFYGDEPERVDICPRERAADGAGGVPTLTKCCLLERGIEWEGAAAVVPWGANLDEVRQALRLLAGVEARPRAGVA